MIELNSFYKDKCLLRQCADCQFGPWITTEVSDSCLTDKGYTRWEPQGE